MLAIVALRIFFAEKNAKVCKMFGFGSVKKCVTLSKCCGSQKMLHTLSHKCLLGLLAHMCFDTYFLSVCLSVSHSFSARYLRTSARVSAEEKVKKMKVTEKEHVRRR